MSRRLFLGQSFAILGLAGLSVVGCSSPGSGNPLTTATNSSQSKTEMKTIKLESNVFKANSLIPGKYTCDGEDISPPLSWDEPPSGTLSFALIVDDPDAPGGIFVHWVLYDIPAKVRQLTAGIAAVSTLPGGGMQGKNDFGKLGYGGPCPPSGTHRYFFKLYALDKKLGLEPGATKAQIVTAMEGHILAMAELIGRYQRQHQNSKP